MGLVDALRICTRLTAPIPELPELTPLVGRTVEIIVIEEAEVPESQPASNPPVYDFWHGPNLQQIHEAQGKEEPVTSIDDLRAEGLEDAFEGFDVAVREWRRRGSPA